MVFSAQKTAATRQLPCVFANRPSNRRVAHSQKASGKHMEVEGSDPLPYVKKIRKSKTKRCKN
uniref:Uncharacterized protein n=2 Tax=Wuchereria bancrofti TaxID=6293 RepID=A0AAF5PKM5_WUCBA